MPAVTRQFLLQRGRRSAGQLRRRRIHHGQNRSFPIERLLELIVALAPVQIGRDQRIDVGVDDEVPGRVVARRNRKDKCDHDRERRERRQQYLSAHFLFLMLLSLPGTAESLPETHAVYRSSVSRSNVVLGFFSGTPTSSAKNAETTLERLTLSGPALIA